MMRICNAVKNEFPDQTSYVYILSDNRTATPIDYSGAINASTSAIVSGSNINIALNYTDGILYYRNNLDLIKPIGGSGGGTSENSYRNAAGTSGQGKSGGTPRLVTPATNGTYPFTFSHAGAGGGSGWLRRVVGTEPHPHRQDRAGRVGTDLHRQ